VYACILPRTAVSSGLRGKILCKLYIRRETLSNNKFGKHHAMSQYIHVPFALALLIAVGWTTLFSCTSKPGIRGFRNLGILVSYILVLVFLFVAGWRAALAMWAAFGVAGGIVYICWETLQRLRTPAGEERPGVSFSPQHLRLTAFRLARRTGIVD
jgi:hypothetical protein